MYDTLDTMGGEALSQADAFNDLVDEAHGLIRGRFDGVKDSNFIGWAADLQNPVRRLTVEIVCKDEVVAVGEASEIREDLKVAGVGDGKHGFLIPLPEMMFDGVKRILSARVLETGDVLDNEADYVFVSTVEGVISGVEGIELVGEARDETGCEEFEIEVLEGGAVFASTRVDDKGIFRVRLPSRLFDGAEHQFELRTVKPETVFARRTIHLPAVSAAELVLRHWIGFSDAESLSDETMDALIENIADEENEKSLVGLILRAGLFCHLYYQQQAGVSLGVSEAVEHFLREGAEQGYRAMPGFDPSVYRSLNSDLSGLSAAQCFVHYVLKGRQEKRYFSLLALKRDAAELRLNPNFDSAWYASKMGEAVGSLSVYEHYLAIGWRKGVMPNRKGFDSGLYLYYYEDARESDVPPYLHYLRQKGRRISRPAEIEPFTRDVAASGLFDSAYYRMQLKKSLPQGVSELAHYLTQGYSQQPDPSAEFSLEYYLRKYPDLKNSGFHPFTHYALHGKDERRAAKLYPEQLIASGGSLFDPNKPTVLIACHEASRTGAPILGLRLVEQFAQQANIISWNGKKGPLTDDFAKSSVAVIEGVYDQVDSVWLVREIQKRFALQFAVVNSVCAVGVAAALYEERVPVLALVHEYADYMGKQVVQMLKCANRVVFPSEGVKASAELVAIKAFEQMSSNVVVRHQGRCALPKSDSGQEFTKEEILLALGVSEDDEVPAIVLGCGWVQIRKGVEYFIEAARLVKQKLNRPVRFIWVGGGYSPDTDLLYSSWLRSQIVNSDLQDEVIFFEETIDLEPFFDLADVFFLSSRLDPFPNVAIDSVNAAVPIVAFERGTGFSEFIVAHPTVGAAVPFLDTEAASKAICEYINGDRASPTKSKEISRLFSFADYADFVWAEGMKVHDQQEEIIKESEMIARSNFMDTGFFKSSRPGWHSYLPPQYEYVSMWSRGIKLAKSRPGFNDKIAEDMFAASEDAPSGSITPLARLMTAQSAPLTHDVVYINHEEQVSPWQGKLRVALHVHAHYTDSMADLLHRLGPLGRKIWLCVTTNTDEKAKAIVKVIEDMSLDGEVVVIPNRGRDVGPFIMMMQDKLSDFDVVGHFHLKGTKQLDQTMVRQWQDFLYDSLLGKNGEVANELFKAFENDPGLGLLFQEEPNLLGWNKNLEFARALLSDIGIEASLPDNIEYPTGDMFWARTSAFAPLMRRNWEWKDFPAEPVPYDGSILHAIERVTPIICQEAGYTWATVFNPAARRCRLS